MYVEITYPKFKAFTDEGLLAVGYKVYTKDAGLTSDVVTYSERTLTTENTNPIVLDEAGECLIFVGQAVKLIFTAPDGNESSPIWTMDYLGEQQDEPIIIVSANSGTTYNNYSACPVPALTSMPADGVTIVLIPDVDNLDTAPTTVFSGTGKNDCYIHGPYTGTTSGSIFTVTIDDATSVPNTFKWRKDGGTWTTGVEITTTTQNLIEGMSLIFSENSGHTLNDTWTATVVTPARFNLCSFGSLIIYKNKGGTLVGLDAGDMKANIPAFLSVGDSQSLYILTNPSSLLAPSTTGVRSRKGETDDYTLLTTDAGNLIDFNNSTTKTLTLDAANTYNGMFFYIRAGGLGDVVIAADGSEVIYSKQSPLGNSNYLLYGGRGDVVQIQCNGVSWEVLTEFTSDVSINNFTSSGTYTPADGKVSVLILCRASGGSGGGGYHGGGGGGGGAALKAMDIADITAPVTVTVATSVAGGAPNTPGNDGGTSSFGAYCSATGGKKGGASSENYGGLGGAGVGGDINYAGANGGDGSTGYGAGGASYGLDGGATQSADGGVGNNYGGGGAGRDGSAAGGASAPGKVIVIEFPPELAVLPYLLVGLLRNVGTLS